MNSLYYKFAALPLFFLFTISFTSSASAEEVVSQTVNLESGWNIVSTPMVLDSHEFSAEETSDNFDIYVLDASKPTGWATMFDLGQTEFIPLYGYFINNKTGNTQTLTFNYDNTVEPNEKLFNRTFIESGWYSIGVANAEYAKTQKADREDTDNPSKILNLLIGKYDTVIDFTDSVYNENRKSVAVEDKWKATIPADINDLNDLRDTKGYAIYIKEAGASYNGFQNDPVNEVFTPAELVFSLSSSNPEATNIIVDEDSVTNNVTILEYTVEAKNDDIKLNELWVNLQTGTKNLKNVVDKISLLVGDEVFAETIVDVDSTAADFTFTSEAGSVVSEGETVNVKVLVDFKSQQDNYAVYGETIQAKVDGNLVQKTISIGDDEQLGIEQVTGSAVGATHSLMTRGIIIPVAGFSSVTDTLGENDTIGKFTLEFEVTAVEGDYYITDNVSSTTTNNGVKYSVEGGNAMITATLTSTSDEDTDGVFTVREGETETFTLRVTVDPAATGIFRVSLDEVWYSSDSSGENNADSYYLLPASDFRTSSISINN